MYVTELVAAGTVNTMPGTTLAAFADHGEVTGNTISGRYHDARHVLDQLATPPRNPDPTAAADRIAGRRAIAACPCD